MYFKSELLKAYLFDIPIDLSQLAFNSNQSLSKEYEHKERLNMQLFVNSLAKIPHLQ